MKLFFCTLFLFVFFEFNFLNYTVENEKGVYVIRTQTKGYGNDAKTFKFPNDSIFVDNEFLVEKVIRLEFYDFYGKTDLIESLDTYHLINLKKGLYKNLGKTLKQETKDISWVDLKEKKLGFNFCNKWYNNESYKIKDTVYNGKKTKKIEYVSKTNIRYDILLQQNLLKNTAQFFLPVLRISSKEI